jgi:ABC-2 type transport system permease protein
MSALTELTWLEIKLFLREPLTAVFVLVLPLVVLYVLNGVFGSRPDPSV